MKQSVSITTLILFLLLFYFACSQVPEKEVNAAIRMQENAKLVKADLYAKESYEKAEMLLADVNAKISNREHEKARILAIGAASMFEIAALEGKANEEKLSLEIPGLSKKASERLLVVEEMLAKNRAALKSRKADIASIASVLRELKDSLTEASEDDSNGKYMEAKLALEGAIEKLGDMESFISKRLTK